VLVTRKCGANSDGLRREQEQACQRAADERRGRERRLRADASTDHIRDGNREHDERDRSECAHVALHEDRGLVRREPARPTAGRDVAAGRHRKRGGCGDGQDRIGRATEQRQATPLVHLHP
jgi:hypothetical protein